MDEILAVHFWMHKAEGELFRDALARAAVALGLRLVRIPEGEVEASGAKWLDLPADALSDRIARLGKAVGPPWAKDQKQAALAAMIALDARSRGRVRAAL